MKKIGFTGTRKGMTPEQRRELQKQIASLLSVTEYDEFHHGDCIGADAQFHADVCGLGCVVVHPPVDAYLRAFCESDNCEVREARPYLVRDKDIVREVEVLFVCPKGFKQEDRSGTWATYRYAKAVGRTVVVIWPDGTVG